MRGPWVTGGRELGPSPSPPLGPRFGAPIPGCSHPPANRGGAGGGGGERTFDACDWPPLRRPLTRAGGPLCDVTISCWSVRICALSPGAAAAAAPGVRSRAPPSPGQSPVCGAGCEHRRPGDARPHNYLSAPVAAAAPGESRPRDWGLRAPQDTPCAPLSGSLSVSAGGRWSCVLGSLLVAPSRWAMTSLICI